MNKLAMLLAGACAIGAGGACKKSGGGGGGGGWLVGDTGMMVNVRGGEAVGDYDLGATEQLNAIACRDAGEAWVAGADGTLLYTDDGGDSWDAVAVPTTADLRALATQDNGPVFVAGDGTFLVTEDGASWRDVGDGATKFRSLSAAWGSDGALAVSEDGGVWQYRDGVLARHVSLPGARAVHQSFGGDIVVAAGHGLWRSMNGGATFQPLTVDDRYMFDDVSVDADGSAIAVGAGGAIAKIDTFGGVTVQRVGTSDLHTVHIHHDTTGYAAGDGGVVWITADKGATWREGPNVGRTVRGVDEIGYGHR
jgi:photosystem II stability/assembly factor-like uncharacterized protein